MVQQAQVLLQNQAQEAHAPAALAEQAQAPAQATEVSLEVRGTLFYPFIATFCSGSLVFRFHTLYVVCPTWAVFHIYYLIYYLPLFRVGRVG